MKDYCRMNVQNKAWNAASRGCSKLHYTKHCNMRTHLAVPESNFIRQLDLAFLYFSSVSSDHVSPEARLRPERTGQRPQISSKCNPICRVANDCIMYAKRLYLSCHVRNEQSIAGVKDRSYELIATETRVYRVWTATVLQVILVCRLANSCIKYANKKKKVVTCWVTEARAYRVCTATCCK